MDDSDQIEDGVIKPKANAGTYSLESALDAIGFGSFQVETWSSHLEKVIARNSSFLLIHPSDPPPLSLRVWICRRDHRTHPGVIDYPRAQGRGFDYAPIFVPFLAPLHSHFPGDE